MMTDPSNEMDEVRSRLLGARSLFSVSELYHENSKITVSAPGLAQSREAVLVAPSGFKKYQHSPSISLPSPQVGPELGLVRAILDRRSERAYSGERLSLEALSNLTFYSLGLAEDGYRRNSPSAGGLYPLELYVVSFNVENLQPALFHYAPRSHGLAIVRPGDHRAKLAQAIFIEEAVAQASLVVIVTGVFGRSKIKYGERAYRFALLEAGHAMQNICLIAAAFGLGVCPIGGFVDDTLNDLLDIDGVEEAALYAATVGRQVDTS